MRRQLLDKATRLYAQGVSSRGIASRLGIDRDVLTRRFRKTTKPSFKYMQRVAQDVLNNNLKYSDVLQRYGNRGITALFYYPHTKYLHERSEVRKRAMSLMRRGKTYQEAAAAVGVTPASLHTILVTHGFSHPRMKKASILRQKVFTLYNRTKSSKKVADQLGISRSYVRFILNEAGISLRSSRLQLEDYLLIHRLRKEKTPWMAISLIFNKNPAVLRVAYTNHLPEVLRYEKKVKNSSN